MNVSVQGERHVCMSELVGNDFGQIATTNTQTGRRLSQVVRANVWHACRALRRLVRSSHISKVDRRANTCVEDQRRIRCEWQLNLVAVGFR